MLEQTEQNDIPGLRLLIEFQKAFESLYWSLIQKALKFLYFGYLIRRSIKVFYNDISSAVIQNGNLSSLFLISRGCGRDLLSPYNHNLC